MYLLNRNVVSAKELAERFEVSVRTIVRDVDALSIAGIPISSSTGASDGYEILDTFKLNKQITTMEDYLFIITALKGMCSAYDNKKINTTLEKLLTAGHYKDEEQRVFIDSDFKKEIVAFANTNGGMIYIGVRDSGKINLMKVVSAFPGQLE